MLNSEPYTGGWIAKVQISDESELDKLMDAAAYDAYCCGTAKPMFTPHTKADVEVMLKTIGIEKVADLFKVVPEKNRFPDLNLPQPLSEMEAVTELDSIASANATTRDFISFLGAGAYQHYIPAAVDNLLQRGEFYTAYTPYQPEISQGTLQAIFEFQSLISLLTGMDVSNASHYDGATAAAEAVILANNHFRGKRCSALPRHQSPVSRSHPRLHASQR